MTDPPDRLYHVRPDGFGTWEVCNIFTGEIAVVDGTECRMLDIEQAADLVDLLNADYINGLRGMTH